MKPTIKLGICFLALLLLFTSVRSVNAVNSAPFKQNDGGYPSCCLILSDSNQTTIAENKTFQFNIFTKLNFGFSKQFSESLASHANYLWKFDKKYFYIRYPDTLEYSLEITDIIYPFHHFL